MCVVYILPDQITNKPLDSQRTIRFELLIQGYKMEGISSFIFITIHSINEKLRDSERLPVAKTVDGNATHTFAPSYPAYTWSLELRHIESRTQGGKNNFSNCWQKLFFLSVRSFWF